MPSAGPTARSWPSSRARRTSTSRPPGRAAAPATSSTTRARQGTFDTPSGKEINVTLAHNPSHLEFVDPVVEGRTRADQTDRARPEAKHDPRAALPVLIHGDAAFPGEGVVAETLNLEALEGYTTGGTIHIIANNQIGFTTRARGSRARRATPRTWRRASTSRSCT